VLELAHLVGGEAIRFTAALDGRGDAAGLGRPWKFGGEQEK
jgi:hypothetical protein